ncbi:hypothetical protein G3I77_12775 [Streptomyces sp. D2-8]|uniref:hypothetical protein n=1 Tax=Streptomyces sp. D2-8 TaxID=2707767 RepID=UPI0020C0754A|nr:hypothetical protein [Streptomyces sp. D2-8]MCK8433876.1 hypothetical protein [Streptomyces sp. D2-8]
MTTTEKLSWPREEDEQWAAAVELRLALDQQAPAGLASRILTEAHDAVTETGRTARDLFGAPAAYARSVAEERIGEEYRARIDSRGMTPGERLTSSLATLGVVGLVVSVLRWNRDGPWQQASWSSITGFSAVVLAAVLVAVALAARAAGRIVGTWGFAAGAVVTVGSGMAAAGVLSEERLFDVPTPALAVAGGALTVAAVMLPDATVDRWFTPGLRGSDERWLSHVEGLLRGRHAMPAVEARAHVQEARQHLASSGDSAEQAFGRAEVYAMNLAEGPRREQRLARRRLYGVTAVALLLAMLFADELRDPQPSSVWFWFYAAAVAYWIWYAARMWWRASSADGRKDHARSSAGPE